MTAAMSIELLALDEAIQRRTERVIESEVGGAFVGGRIDCKPTRLLTLVNVDASSACQIKNLFSCRWLISAAFQLVSELGRTMSNWISNNLRNRFLTWTGATLVFVSVLFLLLLVGLYRDQLNRERKQASHEISRLLQSSLENAMLKRDLPGLRDIVARLGSQPGIRNVAILNPSLEVRFASNINRVGELWQLSDVGLCEGCSTTALATQGMTSFTRRDGNIDSLRSINPVHNQQPCTGCHGPIAAHPINGLLVVDYDAMPIRNEAKRSAMTLTGLGGIVTLLTLASGWWFMQRHVLTPVADLARASERLASGDLAARTAITGKDELALLGRSFNQMAEHLQQTVENEKNKERFLQSLIDAIPDGIRVIAPDHRVLMANEAFCRMHGKDMEQVRLQPCYVASHARTEPCPSTLQICPLQQLATSGHSVKTVARHICADGTPLDVETFASPLTIYEGGKKLACIVESVRDLDQDIRYSQEMKLSEVGRLATGVAHEIYNPLASIRIALQGSLRALQNGTPNLNEVHNYLQLVDGEIDHCVDVTERLLKLGSGFSRPQLVVLNTIVRDTLSLIRWEAAQKGVEIVEQLDASEPRVIISESDMRIVVLNLTQNALHAMPEGGKLTVSTVCRNGMIELTVTDTGVGIALEDRNRIFMPFFSRRADGVQGTGLGLSICKNVVEGIGGSISVQSEVGHGSQFKVTMPDANSVGKTA